uniref:Uncharacterized protein n=1 Tax=Cacopsylla melanoneura TaxID=428564 RepID=A0A8D9AV16_9HEMI
MMLQGRHEFDSWWEHETIIHSLHSSQDFTESNEMHHLGKQYDRVEINGRIHSFHSSQDFTSLRNSSFPIGPFIQKFYLSAYLNPFTTRSSPSAFTSSLNIPWVESYLNR